ncbi:helix-turn-helix domain-containing protein [Streptomyces sp. NPDC055966]|uniref:helix-turn-helix domain-containing protein n=1 Tax=Streptomyces sp. NPDC055966 TaxID=3345669 RepID=UPI0035E1B377
MQEPESASARRDRRAEDILAMQRAARAGGSGSLLRWLAGRTGAGVLLVDPDGAVPASAGGCQAPDLALARRAADELHDRGLDSLMLDAGCRTVVIVSMDGTSGGRAHQGDAAPVLAAVMPRPVPDGLPVLLADVSSVLDLCWRLERTEARWRRLERAEARNREAVLHLLMSGHVATARQIAGLLEPALPDVMRFHVVESPTHLREDVARRCTALAPGAWVVPCPVYPDHVLVLAPAESGEAASALASTLTGALDHCLVGVSDSVPLHETATGYEQAFRALVTARGHADRWATFVHRTDPVLVIGPELRHWARQLLAPLHCHVARRPQDPDSAELSLTAAFWLTFSARAAALLKIHRNTVSARLRQVEILLTLDLDRLPDQAVLTLALRAEAQRAETLDAAPPPGPPAQLDDLLTSPAVLAWARGLLRPVDESGLGPTLDTWLRHDARLAPTAAELSLSTTAVRKRLTRIEDLLERPLLRPPSDRYDLWLARRALFLTGRDATVGDAKGSPCREAEGTDVSGARTTAASHPRG